MKIILLSLKNDVGEKRRSKLNYDYETFWGFNKITDVPEFIKNKMRRNNCSDNLFRGKCCHFFSYFSILKKIVENKIDNVIVCEDDAILKTKLEDFYNVDYPMLMTGELLHPTNYKKKLEDKIDFKDGVNFLDYSKYRWCCSAAIYYPSYKNAEEIIKKIENSKSITHTDLWLGKNQLVKYIYYPSIFKIKDDKVSQISKGKGEIDNYNQ